MPFTSEKTEAAYSLAEQALADDESVFVYRVQLQGATSPVLPKPTQWRQEAGAVIAAIESAGWQLDRFEAMTNGPEYTAFCLFRRDLR